MAGHNHPAGLENRTAQEWITGLLELGDPEARRQSLGEAIGQLDEEEIARQLKAQADQALRADLQRSLRASELLIHLAGASRNPGYRALGLLAEANARGIGLGEYERAIQLYDQAAAIYQENGRAVERATAQIGKIGVLTFLGRYQEAQQAAGWAAEILEAAGEWAPLAKLLGNAAIIHYRLGDDREALAAFDRVQQLYERAGMGDNSGWVRAEINRGIVLRNLGRFEESIQSSQLASQKLEAFGQHVEAARARQNLALTYFWMGRYNEALEILDHVREVFLADGRQRDAILVDLFTSDCLLQLRRFGEVLEKCQQVREAFTQLGTRFEVSLAILNEAVAYAGQKRFDEALASLEEAGRQFAEQGNRTWVAYARLETAAVYLRNGQVEACMAAAQACMQEFESQPVKRAQACLLAARACLALGRFDRVEALLAEAMQVGEDRHVPALTYAARSALGKLAEERGDLGLALEEYDQAIQDLERLRGRLMIEFRADFLEDKGALYEDAVALSIGLGRPGEALEYAERAKSRSLLELISYRLDLRIAALDPEDHSLANDLLHLRAERDRIFRRWESSVKEEMRFRGDDSFDQEAQQAQAEVLEIEKKITDTWHKLLIRNAGYARDAALWQVRVEPAQPYLQEGTLLLEYYYARGQGYAFLVTPERVEVRPLPGNLAEVQRLLGLLWLNWKAVSRSGASLAGTLRRNANGILGQLNNMLLEPLGEALAAHPKVIVVPHGPLHYLPFHALFDGQDYLIARHEVSYLPAGSFLRYCREAQPAENGFLVVGNSYHGRLSYTLQEAQAVARLWDKTPLIEAEATLERIQKEAQACRGLHLAAHGSFRADNPLFSGLALADGWLTTLDIFNLRLRASLVTLSACETGRSLVKGGDELLGLMRAFLYAGTASLVLSQWAVDDRSSALLMELFYTNLVSGTSKGAALRLAQLALIRGETQAGAEVPEAYAHPYYWAPFFLAGDTGPF